MDRTRTRPAGIVTAGIVTAGIVTAGRALAAVILGAAALLAGAGPVTAQAPVDLELVLAADGSGSIDDVELRLQREGYAAAITDPEILAAISAGIHGAIAVTYIEWGDARSQETIVDWMLIRDGAGAAAFAAALTAAPRAAWGWNSISGAIDHGAAAIAGNAYQGRAKIIDVSGDGPNHGGRPIAMAREAAVRAGITINALVIRSPGGGYPGPRGEPLDVYYRTEVIDGFGAFVMTAERGADFARAVRAKMLREIAWGVSQPTGWLAMNDGLDRFLALGCHQVAGTPSGRPPCRGEDRHR